MAPPAMVSRKAKRKAAREEKKRSRNKRQRGSGPGEGGSNGSQQHKHKQQKRPAFKRPHARRAGGGGAAESGGFVNRFHELVEETTGTPSTSTRADFDLDIDGTN